MSETPQYTYTQDWFHWAPQVWEQLVIQLPERKRFLEIGSFEGRSTVWTVENMLEDGGELVAIDTWEGGEEHEGVDLKNAESLFDQNMALLLAAYPERYVNKVKAKSAVGLAQIIKNSSYELFKPFDFVYIDGSHVAKDVLTDACMAWHILKVGGVLVFDDYVWGDPRDVLHRHKLAIDAFVNLFADDVDILHMGYQFVIRKNK